MPNDGAPLYPAQWCARLVGALRVHPHEHAVANATITALTSLKTKFDELKDAADPAMLANLVPEVERFGRLTLEAFNAAKLSGLTDCGHAEGETAANRITLARRSQRPERNARHAAGCRVARV